MLTRVPPKGQIEPEPEEGEYVVFAAHFDRGFALPMNNFTKKFLSDFKLQPHHLPANAILTMSSFVTFCEAYVGVVASLRTWAKYFPVRSAEHPQDQDHRSVWCCFGDAAQRVDLPSDQRPDVLQEVAEVVVLREEPRAEGRRAEG